MGMSFVRAINQFNGGAHIARTWQDGLVIDKRWKYTNILVRAPTGSNYPTSSHLVLILLAALESYASRRHTIVSVHRISGPSILLICVTLSVPPIPQIVFYQAGVGTEPNLYQSLIDGRLTVYFSRSHLP
jgi:hypothetical protein